MANKVTHIINCAGRQVPNHWEPIGVKYLTYFWLDQDSQVILDSKDQVANECFAFITEALEKGDSVLVHSVKGQSRACTIVAAWIMRRYQWTLLKTLEFLNSRRPDLEIRANFIHQLTAHENRLVSTGLGPKTSKWTEVFEKTNEFENEELLLRNTYLNAQMGPFADFSISAADRPRPSKVRWVDDSSKEKFPLATVIGNDNDGKAAGVAEGEKKDLSPIMKPGVAQPAGHSRNGKGVSESASANSGKDDSKRAAAPTSVAGAASATASKGKSLKQYSAREPSATSVTAKPIVGTATMTAAGTAQKSRPAAESKGTINQTKPMMHPKDKPTALRTDDMRDRTAGAAVADVRIIPKFNNFVDSEHKHDHASTIKPPIRTGATAAEYGSKITESISQMMDLHSSMNEKCTGASMYPPLSSSNNATATKGFPQQPPQPKAETVTHIINQNNINNYIIHNPQKVEVIEYTHPTKSEVRTVAEPIVKKIIPPKKTTAPVRSASATVRRDPPPAAVTKAGHVAVARQAFCVFSFYEGG